jgi:hypothetical protein
VEFTSPTTTIQSGLDRSSRYSIMTRRVCPAWLPPPTPRCTCGFGSVEERIGHVRVVVLAGVDDPRAAPRLRLQRMVQRRDLHEVRARGGDEIDGEDVGHG